MNVLILGGGYVGNHLFNYLKNKCTVEQIVQNQVDYTFTNPNSKDFKSYLHDKHFDIAVNCSGYTGKPNVDACEDDKANCWEYNVLAPVRTAETLNLFKIPVIHVSSGCIYQGLGKFTEEDVPNFGLYDDESSFYSKSKHAGVLVLLRSSRPVDRLYLEVYTMLLTREQLMQLWLCPQCVDKVL